MGSADWRDRSAEDVTCIRCLEVRSIQELDRLLWCEECLALARRRAVVRGWIAGGTLFLVLALYVGLWIQPDFALIPSAWLATLAAAFYLGARVAREFIFGWDRLRNRRAIEASPPNSELDLGGGGEKDRIWE